MIVLDASVLIAHLDADDANHERATELLLECAVEPLAASRLTLAEVLVGPARVGALDQATSALRELDVTGIGLEPDAPVRLAVLRAESGLKLPDCCVLLAAEQVGAAVASFDGRLLAAARRRGLPILEDAPGHRDPAAE